ncbi:MAG: hypothetical protein WC301_07450 [Candidatus Omnitrophota bacterium]|jgi:hypothetical protein
MANDIAGIKTKIKTLMEAVTGMDKVYEYGIKEITAYTCMDIWWDGVEDFIPETTHTYRVGWRFELTVYIKGMDAKARDIKLQTLLFLIFQKFWENPDLDFPTYVDRHELGRTINGINPAFKTPHISAKIPLVVYTEETRTG